MCVPIGQSRTLVNGSAQIDYVRCILKWRLKHFGAANWNKLISKFPAAPSIGNQLQIQAEKEFTKNYCRQNKTVSIRRSKCESCVAAKSSFGRLNRL